MDVQQAFRAVKECNDVMDRLQDKCRRCVEAVLAARIQGRRAVVSDGNPIVSPSIVRLVAQRAAPKSGNPLGEDDVREAESVLAAAEPVVDETARRYSRHGTLLAAVLHCYHNCRFRSAQLTMAVVTALVQQICSRQNSAAFKGELFVEAILSCGVIRYEQQRDSLTEVVKDVIQQHLTPFLAKDASQFHIDAYSVEVRNLLHQKQDVLKAVFDCYSKPDVVQQLGKEVPMVSYEDFIFMLHASKSLTAVVTGEKVAAFMVTLCAEWPDDEDVVAVDLPLEPVSQELAFPDFIDAVVMVAMSVEMDPFRIPREIIEGFLVELVDALRTFWSAREEEPKARAFAAALEKSARKGRHGSVLEVAPAVVAASPGT